MDRSLADENTLKNVKKRAQEAVSLLSISASEAGAILFGSQINGKADEWSDIDIAVFLDDSDELTFDREMSMTSNIHKKLGYDLELHFFPASDLTQADPASFAAYVLKHGLPIPLPQNQFSEKID